MALTGTHLVRGLRSAFQKAKHLWPAVGDRMEVRWQALKLRFGASAMNTMLRPVSLT